MPNYNYICRDCGNFFEQSHAIGYAEAIRCLFCGSVSTQKAITSFYIGGNGFSPSAAMSDLKENYGIESVNMRNGDFKTWYKGVRRDGARVAEQMIQGKERQEKSARVKHAEFKSRVRAKPIDKLKQKR
jgi:putative FmdB family regulatory protein